MSEHGIPQEDGKIVVAAPELAAALVEYADEEHAARIYTLPGLPENAVYVIDLDQIAEFF